MGFNFRRHQAHSLFYVASQEVRTFLPRESYFSGKQGIDSLVEDIKYATSQTTQAILNAPRTLAKVPGMVIGKGYNIFHQLEETLRKKGNDSGFE